MRLLAAATFILLFAPLPGLAETTRFCNIQVEAEEKVEFTAVEEQWLCGDPESEAWSTIPVSQQQMFLRSFLQSKGYHDPDILQEGGNLLVKAGPLLRVSSFTVTGAPREWNWAKRWGLIGRPLTPAVLDEASGWARRELQQRGFPCPSVSALAMVDTGELRIEASPGEASGFGEIETIGTSDLDPAVLERFSAFRTGQTFDIRLLELTSTRILQEDLYLSTYFDLICREGEAVRLVRRSVPALPRLFTIGAGFDTDRGPIARSRLRWSRIGPAANSLDLTLFLSLREQTLSSRFHYFFTGNLSSRLRLIPLLTVERLSEETFITVTSQIGTRLANSWDRRGYQIYAEAGPLLERVNTIRGDSPSKIDNLRLSGRIAVTSHLFEYYLSDPRTGWMASLESSSQFRGVLADSDVHRLFLQHQILWNLWRWDPPFLILGWRGFLGSFLFGQRATLAPEVPVSQRFFLGGDDNIRGFSRKEIPGDGSGFFTSIYQGFELRTGGWFPWNLQPFLFFDWAKGGMRARRIDPTAYYAPGLGLRYESPIGTIRTTLGRGFVSRPRETDPPPHLQFFFSFGREF